MKWQEKKEERVQKMEEGKENEKSGSKRVK
jgi:hypothetical protein